MTPDDKRIRQRLKDDFKHYALKCLKVRSKSGEIISFHLNRAQQFIHQRLEVQKDKHKAVRAIVLKGRQQGCSTYVGARFFHKVVHHFGTQAFILTHALDATQNLYKMAQRFYENTPELIKPQVTTSNAKELIFGTLDSGYKLGTAENKSVGRSATIQLLHASEVAFWNNASEHAKGILQAVPSSDNTEIIMESTANGVGNYFHQQWQQAEAGLSDYIAIFVPWYWQDEYAKVSDNSIELTAEERELKQQYLLIDEQLNWRRAKIAEFSVNGIDGTKAFRQEYPFNSSEAFVSSDDNVFIDNELVMRCRKSNIEKYGPLYIGVDPARFGDDRTSIIRRRGRVAYDLESYTKLDTMEVTGRIVRIIQAESPDKIFIDVGGLGAGIVDRLNELGYKQLVIPVNAGSKALDTNRYMNKRAEMWGLTKKWLEDEPCQIPDSDSLHADLSACMYSFDSNTRLKIESKEDMKKRGIRSSDEADALCLTHALPFNLMQNDSKSSSVAAKIMKNQDDFWKAKEQLYHGYSQ